MGRALAAPVGSLLRDKLCLIPCHGFLAAVPLARESKLLIHAHSHEAVQLSLRANDRHGEEIIQCARLLL
jgi:hypothetical protein